MSPPKLDSVEAVRCRTVLTPAKYATQGIRVNCLCPGVIDTPMVGRFTHDNPDALGQLTQMEPVARLGRPREVAELALFLASDRSSFITGAIIPVDGGFVAR